MNLLYGPACCGQECPRSVLVQDLAGQRWKAVHGARSYCVEQADEAAPEAWTLATSSTKARATVKGLMSGRKYWLRVAAIGSAGQGAWSEVVGRVAG